MINVVLCVGGHFCHKIGFRIGGNKSDWIVTKAQLHQYVDPTSLSFRVGLPTKRDSNDRGKERKGVTRAERQRKCRCHTKQCRGVMWRRHTHRSHGVAANVVSSRGSVERDDNLRVDVTRINHTE